MYPLYKDIRRGMGIPKWIDSNGVPRYSEFHPSDACKIYCDWVAFLTVECQSCGKMFKCANAVAYYRLAMDKYPPESNSVEHVAPYVIGWGDAPWHGFDGDEVGFDSQCAGTTMCAEVIDARLFRSDHRNKEGEFEGWIEIENPMQYIELESS